MTSRRDHRPLDPVALDLLSRATLSQMRDDADKLASLARETLQPLPPLPLDAVQRERMLATLLLQARDRAQRLLTVVASGDVRS